MIPVLLELRNFFSHKKTSIDFTQFDSALLIGNTEGNYDLSNGSGKSAIFESVLWCLFNKARVAAMEDIILWGEESCSVQLTFKQGDLLYKVLRNRSRVTDVSNVSLAYLSDDDEWIDISGSTAGLTNAKIVSVLKFDYKTFVNSAYFRQNDISEFAESDPGRKKEILKSIIDLSKWDEYEKEAKARLKTIRSEAEILQAKIDELDQDEISLSRAATQYSALEIEIDDLSVKRRQAGDSLEDMLKQYQEIRSNIDTDKWDQIVAENKFLTVDLKRLEDKVLSLNNITEQTKDKLKTLKLQLDKFNEEIKDIVVDLDIDEKIKKSRDWLVSYRAKLSTAKNMLEILDKKNIAEEICNVCGQNVSADLHNELVHNHNEEKERYKTEAVFAGNKIEECNAMLKQYDEVQKNNKRAETLTDKNRSIKEQINILKDSLAGRSSELTNAKNDLLGVKSKIDLNMSILDTLKNDNFQKLHAEIEDKRQANTKLDEKISAGNKELGILSQKIKVLTDKTNKMKKDQAELVVLNKKRAAYEKLNKLLGKNGVQTILLNAVIEDLEKTANQILVSICNEPLSVFLETQRVGADGVSIVDTLDLKVKKDGMTQNFKSLSGGEQFRISLSLRIALSEISSRHGGSSLEFLLLDEINSPLDRHGTENLFVNVIQALEKKYKILVITHSDSLKERFGNVIEVTKVNGESTAQFIQK